MKLKKEEKPELKKSLLQSIADDNYQLCYVMEQCESVVTFKEELEEDRKVKVLEKRKI